MGWADFPTEKGFDPDLAGNTSALLRYLIADFTAKSGK